MNKRCLSHRSVLFIKWLLEEPTISERVMENHKDKEKYKIITVNPEGTIVLGKTSFKWLNQLLACQDKIPFESFALRVWNALVDLSNGENKIAVDKGLSREIITKGVRELNYDWVVERLFDAARYVCQNSTLSAIPGTSAENPGYEAAMNKGVDTININVNGITKVLRFKDSVGDPFIDLEVGITDAKFRHGH